jgi:hypothetical protein
MLAVIRRVSHIHKDEMKFIIEDIETITNGLQRAYNDLQVPEVDVEYETNTDGYVKNKAARVYKEGDVWWWSQESTSYSAYHFKSEPLKIKIRHI